MQLAPSAVAGDARKRSPIGNRSKLDMHVTLGYEGMAVRCDRTRLACTNPPEAKYPVESASTALGRACLHSTKTHRELDSVYLGNRNQQAGGVLEKSWTNARETTASP